MYDVVIVGGGPAGLAAALTLGRARRRVVVVDAGEPRNARASAMHDYLSRDGMPPGELLATGRAEVARYGVELVEDRVVSARPGLAVTLAGGRVLTARRLLVTTGLRDELPDIPGLAELWGTDVVVCPYCHGYEVADQPLGLLAGGPQGVDKAVLIREWSADTVLFTNGYQPTDEELARLAERGIAVERGVVAEAVAEQGRLAGVRLADGRLVARAALFVAPRFVPVDGLLRELGCELTDQGWVRVDAAGRTSVEGVWAVGNVVDPMQNVASSAGAAAFTSAMLNTELVLGPVAVPAR
ncbi:NAD(P)/FAD-dependent oxidoreductase [Actinophytocola sediminis]